MNNWNCEFFDAFKDLDNLCRDIYGTTSDNKLGVTLYLEDMDEKRSRGISKVPNWVSDYNRLKRARNIRNELAHSRNSFSYEVCTEEDVDFIVSFRSRILNQTDPLTVLRRATEPPHHPSHSRVLQQGQLQHRPQKTAPSGCLGMVASFLLVVALSFAFFL